MGRMPKRAADGRNESAINKQTNRDEDLLGTVTAIFSSSPANPTLCVFKLFVILPLMVHVRHPMAVACVTDR
jgi:hypothetical protein